MLGKDSAAELEDGKTPGPLVEIRFWEAKCMNLESLFEQVQLFYFNFIVSLSLQILLTDEGKHDEEDGLHLKCYGQRILPVFQVSLL